MPQIVLYLPILIIAAFPVLYMAGHDGSTFGSLLGIILLFLGMSGSLLKRFTKKKK